MCKIRGSVLRHLLFAFILAITLGGNAFSQSLDDLPLSLPELTTLAQNVSVSFDLADAKLGIQLKKPALELLMARKFGDAYTQYGNDKQIVKPNDFWQTVLAVLSFHSIDKVWQEDYIKSLKMNGDISVEQQYIPIKFDMKNLILADYTTAMFYNSGPWAPLCPLPPVPPVCGEWLHACWGPHFHITDHPASTLLNITSDVTGRLVPKLENGDFVFEITDLAQSNTEVSGKVKTIIDLLILPLTMGPTPGISLAGFYGLTHWTGLFDGLVADGLKEKEGSPISVPELTTVKNAVNEFFDRVFQAEGDLLTLAEPELDEDGLWIYFTFDVAFIKDIYREFLEAAGRLGILAEVEKFLALQNAIFMDGFDLTKINPTHYHLIIGLSGAGVYPQCVLANKEQPLQTYTSKPSDPIPNYNDGTYPLPANYADERTVAVIGTPWLNSVSSDLDKPDDFWGPDPAEFASRIADALSRMAPNSKLVLLGKSLGGCKMQQIAEELYDIGVRVDLLIIVDGSCKPEDQSGEQKDIFENVARVYNFRQTMDSPYNDHQNGFQLLWELPTIGKDWIVSEESMSPDDQLCGGVGHDDIDECEALLKEIDRIIKQELTGNASRFGDKDDFNPGDPEDSPPLSEKCLRMLKQASGMTPAGLDEEGVDRPVGVTHYFYSSDAWPINAATLTVRFKGSQWIKNDLIFFKEPHYPISIILLRDLLGFEPQPNQSYQVSVDLANVPVRYLKGSDDWIVPGTSWRAWEDVPEDCKAFLNLLPELHDGQLDLVFVDDVVLDYSELELHYGVKTMTVSGVAVTATPMNGVYVVFADVTGPGNTTCLKNSYSSLQLPENYSPGADPVFHYIQSSAYFEGPIKVTIRYDKDQFANAGMLRLLHAEDGRFVNRTIALDTVNNFITARVDSLSEFVVAEYTGMTGGLPKTSFGAGEQTSEVTEPGTWRWAEYYYGFEGIDEIKWMKDGSGQWHNYVIGWHQGDLAEYLVKFGRDYSRLILRGMADRPGPVKFNVYIDGEYQGTWQWDRNNNCNQDVTVDIEGFFYGTHAVAVEFAEDFWDPHGGADGDRNLYLDGLKVEASERIESLTGGGPKGEFGAGRQTDEVTEPGTWRWAEYYYGFEGIDEIKWMKDGSGQWHNYVIGWHQGDLAEYLMKFGGEYRRLVLRGMADRPGPVKFNVYIDGIYRGTWQWDRNNNRNQDVIVEIPGIPYATHAIAVEFAEDSWDRYGGADGDRNLYLDGLQVIR